MVAVFSHGDMVKAVPAYIAGIPLDFYYRFNASPASVSVATINDHGRACSALMTRASLFANHYNPTFVRLCTDEGRQEA
jgi:broad specificity phosphatase PhoE